MKKIILITALVVMSIFGCVYAKGHISVSYSTYPSYSSHYYTSPRHIPPHKVIRYTGHIHPPMHLPIPPHMHGSFSYSSSVYYPPRMRGMGRYPSFYNSCNNRNYMSFGFSI